MFAARHLRYEIYEKKQIQPLLGQRRRSRSNRSESEHSLTVSANPRSPDVAGSVGSEALGESAFVYPLSEEAPAQPDATVYHVPEQTALPTVDVRLCRMSMSTLAALIGTPSHGNEAGQTDVTTSVVDVCKAASWPARSFPLVDADYKLLVTELSSDSCCDPSTTSVSDSLMVSFGTGVPPTEPVMTGNPDLTSVIPQSSVHSAASAIVAPVTTL